MAVTVIPNVTNWTVTPQNGQAGYFTLMNTWLGQSTSVIASLQTAITAQNTANSEINTLAIQVANDAIIATGLANYQGAWSNSITYSKGWSVSVSGLYYISKVDLNLNHLVTDTNYWVYNPINDKINKVSTPTTNALGKINADGTIGNSNIINDSNGNLGIGVTPSPWGSSFKSLELQNGTFFSSYNGVGLYSGFNAYYNGASWIYKNSGVIARNMAIESDGAFRWQNAVAGTAGNAITWTNAMSLDASGNLGVGATTQLNGARLNIIIGSGASNYASFSNDHVFYNCTTGGVNASSTAYSVQKISATGRSINAAGTINASGADYAEYEYSNDINLIKGQIVGFKVDGTLTDKYTEAIRFAIKSTNPSIVGGDTWGNEDVVGKRPEQPIKTEEMTNEEFTELEAQYKIDLADFEARLEIERQKVDRIAYAGKVPVNVYGAKAGQYIIAVEKDGGIDGLAVNKADMTFEQYQDAVGRVNKILDDGRAEVAIIIH